MKPCLALLCLALFASLLAAQTYDEHPYYFTTLAGASSIGSADGAGVAARFYRPQGVAIGSTGGLYVADSDNATIRKITPTGVVSTLAGSSGKPGAADGVGSAARFNFPSTLVVDAQGNLLVADANNHAIRQVTPDGVVSTFAGALGAAGSADGDRHSARFHRPEGIARDSVGNLYIADAGNHTIRMIAPNGNVSTIAGTAGTAGYVDATGTAARFDAPFRITVDATGSLYVSEAGNYDIRKITPTGSVTTIYYSRYDSLHGSRAYLSAPTGLVVTGTGRVIFADRFTDTISEVTTPNGAPVIVAGGTNTTGSADGPAAAARFDDPANLVVDAANNLFVVELGNNTVRKISASGEVSTIAGLNYAAAHGTADGTGSQARFGEYMQLAVNTEGALYVTDPSHNTIRRINPDGAVTTLAGDPQPNGSFADGQGRAARFNALKGICVAASGGLVVVDDTLGILRQISSGGLVTTPAPSGNDAHLSNASIGIAASPDGSFVTTNADQTIKRHVINGARTTIAGAGTPGSADGIGGAAYFDHPTGIATDLAGNLYVADSGNSTVRKISPTGTVTTLAGSAGTFDARDGAGTAAYFDHQRGITIDASGNLYVTDHNNHTLRKISPTGLVTTLAGAPGISGQIDGLGPDARLYYPESVTVDAAGNLYITSGTTIRKGQPTTTPAITQQPQSLSLAAGGNASLVIAASGVPSPAFQWYVNGVAIPGGTSQTLSLPNVRTSDAGEYWAVAANALGSVTSAKATLTVTAAPTPPASGSGGGGAPSLWFALSLLSAWTLCCFGPRRPSLRLNGE